MHASILARKEKLSTLQDFLNSDRPEFLAIYGRRRIGKTFMIREFFEKTENIIFFKVLGLQDGTIEEQITHFMRQVSATFFDELPWMATPKGKLLQNLDYF